MLTLGLAGFLILSTGATVAMNHWNRWFFDSLEARDVEAVTSSIFVFAASSPPWPPSASASC